MSTNIDYFGDFVSSIVISEDKLLYIKSAGVEIISEQPHVGIPFKNAEKMFYITFKVTNMTFLYFMSAGIKYKTDQHYKK